jgi:hypothetical protein
MEWLTTSGKNEWDKMIFMVVLVRNLSELVIRNGKMVKCCVDVNWLFIKDMGENVWVFLLVDVQSLVVLHFASGYPTVVLGTTSLKMY